MNKSNAQRETNKSSLSLWWVHGGRKVTGTIQSSHIKELSYRAHSLPDFWIQRSTVQLLLNRRERMYGHFIYIQEGRHVSCVGVVCIWIAGDAFVALLKGAGKDRGHVTWPETAKIRTASKIHMNINLMRFIVQVQDGNNRSKCLCLWTKK
jgi:hypothetical protein